MYFKTGMRTNPYLNYLENEILTADPMKLVVLLYRGALDSIGSARRHLASGDIRARSRSVTRAIEIVAELNQSLDHSRGGEVSANLARLYDFVIGRLTEGNTTQLDRPLGEAERVLGKLLDGWLECQSDVAPAPSRMSASPAQYQVAEAASERFSYAY